MSSGDHSSKDGIDPLTEIALSQPYRLFNQGELARLLRVSDKEIAKMKTAGGPFSGRYSRPEVILEWLHKWLTKK